MAEVSEYKGHPIIDLNPGGWPKFNFGVTKAEMALEQIQEIVTFVEENTNDPTIVDNFKRKMAKLYAQ